MSSESDKRERPPARRRSDEAHIDDRDVDWSGNPLGGLARALPLAISQHGNANDLSVQINVAMLPPVDDFNSYEKAVPGTAEYIMRAADEQRRHRLAIEAQQVARSERRRDVGQLISGLLALVGLGGAITLGLFGSPWVAAMLATIAVGGPLAAQTLAGALARQQLADDRSPQRPVTPPKIRSGDGRE